MELRKLSPRQVMILATVRNKANKVNLDDLVNQLNVSKRTVYREINALNEELKKHNVVLKKTKNQGFSLYGDLTKIDNLNDMTNRAANKSSFCPSSRRNKLILDSLINGEFEKLSYYSMKFNVSESTISNDLKYVEELFAEYKISLIREPGIGISISGKEEDIRFCLKDFVSILLTKGPYDHKLIQEKIYDQSNLDPNFILKVIKEDEKKFGSIFTDESLNSLSIYIAIAIRRMMGGNNINSNHFYNTFEFTKEYELAKSLSQKIAEHHQIDFNENEVYLLFLNIISSKKVKNASIAIELNNHEEDDTARKMALEIIDLVNNIKQITINNSKYIDNLSIHLQPTINRLTYNLKQENPFLEQIKREFPEAYGIAWMTNPIFKRHIGKGISEEEAAYIAIHIQSMIESCMNSLKVVIVCSSGIGISQLLSTKLQKKFRQLEVIGIESISSFNNRRDKSDIDLVLSNFPIETNLPLLLVDPLLNKFDIDQIEKFIFNHSINGHNIVNKIVLETFIHKKYRNQNDVIDIVSKELLNRELVQETFKKGVYEREQIHSTAIGMKVALPHARFETVKKSTLAIVTLTQPIEWGEDEVDLIAFIALTKKDSKWATNGLKEIYHKFYMTDTHERLLKAKSHEEILAVLNQ